jgi:transcription termination factor Rho
MTVLTREALEQSPLSDLHLIARELGIDGYRRLRKAELVDVIAGRQSGEEPTGAAPDVEEDAVATPTEPVAATVDVDTAVAATDAVDETDAPAERDGDDDEEERPRRRRRGGRGRRSGRDREDEPVAEAEDGSTDEDAGDAVEVPEPRERRARRDRAEDADDREPATVSEGVIELLGNGSGFLRVSPPEPSDDDVYVSAAQIRRCELVSGDHVAGPVRPPRRSERYPSLVRVDTINGRAADEVAEGTPFDELAATFPTERLALGSDDATLKAIEWLTPLGRGSRASITGPARAGKTEALRRLAGALRSQEGLELSVVLTGVRPEEHTEWRADGFEPVAALTFAASPDAQAQAVDRAIDTAKRIAARGGDAVVLIDTLDHLHAAAARKVLAAARNVVDGGSLTIIATALTPVGGETTVVALDRALTSTGRFPAVDLVASGTLRPELLVGDAGADAIAQARAAAL